MNFEQSGVALTGEASNRFTAVEQLGSVSLKGLTLPYIERLQHGTVVHLVVLQLISSSFHSGVFQLVVSDGHQRATVLDLRLTSTTSTPFPLSVLP